MSEDIKALALAVRDGFFRGEGACRATAEEKLVDEGGSRGFYDDLYGDDATQIARLVMAVLNERPTRDAAWWGTALNAAASA